MSEELGQRPWHGKEMSLCPSVSSTLGIRCWCLSWFPCKFLLQHIQHSTKHSLHLKPDLFTPVCSLSLEYPCLLHQKKSYLPAKADPHECLLLEVFQDCLHLHQLQQEEIISFVPTELCLFTFTNITYSALSENVLRERVASLSVHHLPLGPLSGVRGLLSEFPWSFPPPHIPTHNLTPEHTQWESNICSWTRFITRADMKNIC